MSKIHSKYLENQTVVLCASICEYWSACHFRLHNSYCIPLLAQQRDELAAKLKESETKLEAIRKLSL